MAPKGRHDTDRTRSDWVGCIIVNVQLLASGAHTQLYVSCGAYLYNSGVYLYIIGSIFVSVLSIFSVEFLDALASQASIITTGWFILLQWNLNI